jgi:hypothetical protein
LAVYIVPSGLSKTVVILFSFLPFDISKDGFKFLS